MGSRQLGNRQMNFLARLYERGTGDSIAVTVSFHEDTILIYLEENGNEPIEVPLDEWEVRVGGSAEDKIVLHARQTGDTLVCGDEFFLTAIAEATDNNAIIQQIKKAKKRNATRFVRQGTGIVAVIICLTMFGGCVTLAFLDAVQHPRHSKHKSNDQVEEQEESAESAGSAESEAEETGGEAAQGEFNGERYMQSIRSKMVRAWTPPSGLKPTKVVVRFSVDKSGKVSHAHVVRTSGIKAIDTSALNAIAKASPLPKLAAGAPNPLDIEYTFDYGKGRQSSRDESQPEEVQEGQQEEAEPADGGRRYD